MPSYVRHECHVTPVLRREAKALGRSIAPEPMLLSNVDMGTDRFDGGHHLLQRRSPRPSGVCSEPANKGSLLPGDPIELSQEIVRNRSRNHSGARPTPRCRPVHFSRAFQRSKCGCRCPSCSCVTMPIKSASTTAGHSSRVRARRKVRTISCALRHLEMSGKRSEGSMMPTRARTR